jgi:hypothetical protein
MYDRYDRTVENREELKPATHSTISMGLSATPVVSFPQKLFIDTLNTLKEHQERLEIYADAFVSSVGLQNKCENIRTQLDGFKQMPDRMKDSKNWENVRDLIETCVLDENLPTLITTENREETANFTQALEKACKAVESALSAPSGYDPQNTADDAQKSAGEMIRLAKKFTAKARNEMQGLVKNISTDINNITLIETIREHESSLSVSAGGEKYADKERIEHTQAMIRSSSTEQRR